MLTDEGVTNTTTPKQVNINIKLNSGEEDTTRGVTLLYCHDTTSATVAQDVISDVNA